MTDNSLRNRRIMIAIVAAVAAIAIVVPVAGVLLAPLLNKHQDLDSALTTTTTTPPPLTIKPLSLRPVTGGPPFVIRRGTATRRPPRRHPRRRCGSATSSSPRCTNSDPPRR